MPDSPHSAGDLLGSAGVPLVLTYKGQPHPVSPATLGVVDRVEKIVARRATEEADRQAKDLPAKWAKRMEDDVLTRLRLREHATGGAMWAAEFEADGGARGVQLILQASLEEGRELAADKSALPPPIPFDDLPAALAESPDAKMVAALLIADFFRGVAVRLKIPPEQTAKLEAAIQKVVREMS